VQNYPAEMTELEKAIDSCDPNQLARVAHSLKGALGSISAMKAQALAKELETIGCTAHLEEASFVLQQLKDELEHITAFFAAPTWRIQ
jgi:HPt (histidine-containing phosphotransfer) domain-containing protein